MLGTRGLSQYYTLGATTFCDALSSLVSLAMQGEEPGLISFILQKVCYTLIGHTTSYLRISALPSYRLLLAACAACGTSSMCRLWPVRSWALWLKHLRRDRSSLEKWSCLYLQPTLVKPLTDWIHRQLVRVDLFLCSSPQKCGITENGSRRTHLNSSIHWIFFHWAEMLTETTMNACKCKHLISWPSHAVNVLIFTHVLVQGPQIHA